ncbi:MAG: 50S ribosomal protein L25/general stress protein Ctc [Prevotellaceae bacterium]|jgi:large subunit ribosomal protein L25|nr:50S ribosomal protein L25/general stress protein Ctc [Prevotellaceae bacterium]
MKTIDLKGSSRAALGKEGATKLRKTGNVPCVIYGNGDNILFAVDSAALHPLVYTPSAYLVNIDIDGKKETAVMRELQFHPISDEILHADFYRIDHSKPITIDVPITLQGSPEGVKLGGKLQQLARKVKISALSQHLPDTLNVDISALGLGKSIFVGDLSFENVAILTPKSAVICAVKMTRAAIGAAASAAAANASPAGAAAPAAAATPAAKKK